jgi:hypothetical protein
VLRCAHRKQQRHYALMARERWQQYLAPQQCALLNASSAHDAWLQLEADLARDLGQPVSHVTALVTRLTHAGLKHVITPTYSNRTLSRDRSWMNPLARQHWSTARQPELCAEIVLKPRDQTDLIQALVSAPAACTTDPDSAWFAASGPAHQSEYAAVAVT